MSFPQMRLPEDDPYGVGNATKLRKLAEALRGRLDLPAPQGAMVSGRFVAPSIAQHLGTLADAWGGSVMDKRATAAEAESGKAIRAARDTWSSSLPQAVAARNVATPDDSEDMPITHEPAKPVTTSAILKHTLAGLNIPGNEKAASIYNAGALADLTREDNQAERRDAAKAAAAAAREKMLEDLKSKADIARQRSEDTRLSIEQRREAAQQHTAMMGMIAQGNQELRRLQIETTAAMAKDNRDAKAAAGPGKLSAKEQADLDAWEASKVGLGQAIEGLKKADSKGTGWAAGVAQNVVPGGQALVAKYRDPAMNAAVQQLTYWTDAIRHERFGSALTATEKASAMQYLPSEYDDKNELLRKAAGLQKIIDDNSRRLSIKGGPRPEKPGATPGAAPTSAAPPATKVLNGKTYVQVNGQWYEQ